MGLGKNIKSILDDKNMKVSELSKISGVPYGTLHAIIKRDSNGVKTETLKKICSALNVSIGELFGTIELPPHLSFVLAMRESGYTIERLSDVTGINAEKLTNFETGTDNPNDEEKLLIARALGIFDDTHVELLFEPILASSNLDLSAVEEAINNTRPRSSVKMNILINHFAQLNNKGQDKALENLELLLKIPEYKKAP